MAGTTAQDKPRIAVTPAPGSVLEDLLSREAAAEAAANEAADRLKSVRDAIKAELSQAHPGISRFFIAGSATRLPKTLTWVETVRLDTKRMKQDAPQLYVEYAVFGDRWELRTARGL